MRHFLLKYGETVTVQFPLYEKYDNDGETTPATFAAGDTKIVLDGAAITNTTNSPTSEGGMIYSLSIDSTETTGKRGSIQIVDQTSPKVWQDQVITFDTYGNASAAHQFDLDDNTANTAGDATAANQTTIISHLTDVKGATWSSSTDTLEAIRDRGDAAWTTGSGAGGEEVLINTTIATLASQTSFTLTDGSPDDGAYDGKLAIITDVSTSNQKAVALVDSYVVTGGGSTKTITLRTDPGIFTMATTDSIAILAIEGVLSFDPTGQPSALPADLGAFFNFMYREMFHKASIDANYRYLWDDAETGKIWKQARTQASGEETRGTLEAGP